MQKSSFLFVQYIPAMLLLGLMVLPLAVSAQPMTMRVSVDSGGDEGNADSLAPSLSTDGRFVAFHSFASNLVPGDTNAVRDVFVHDRQTGVTTRVSVDAMGNQADDGSFLPSISADGRLVAFYSAATNLVPADTNAASDVFVHDRQTGQTTRVSVDSLGNEGNDTSANPRISPDGRFVVFQSRASNLVAGDTNGVLNDVFVHDRQTAQTIRVSVDAMGNEGDGNSTRPAISADGRFVAFQSVAANLVPGDSNGVDDIFVHDRQSGQTTRVSVDSVGAQADVNSFRPLISADGRLVVFESEATNLVPGDTNAADDIFLHDRQTGQTSRISVDSLGNQGDANSTRAFMSADGRFVSYESNAGNLVPGDTNAVDDIFVRDRHTGQTARVSVGSMGGQGDALSNNAALTPDGRFIVFHSDASNLVAGDANGATDVFIRDRGAAFGMAVAVPASALSGLLILVVAMGVVSAWRLRRGG